MTTTLLADASGGPAAPTLPPVVAPNHHGLSLLYGWLPVTIQVIAAIVLLLAIGWRGRRWRYLWLPVCAILGIAAADEITFAAPAVCLQLSGNKQLRRETPDRKPLL